MKEFKYNPNFHSGRFRHRIFFKRSVVTTNPNGFKETTLQDVSEAWAMIKTVSGREYNAAAAVQNQNTYRFVIRYMPGLDEEMTLMYEGRPFNIETILPDDEEQGTLTIIAVENVVKVDSHG